MDLWTKIFGRGQKYLGKRVFSRFKFCKKVHFGQKIWANGQKLKNIWPQKMAKNDKKTCQNGQKSAKMDKK